MDNVEVYKGFSIRPYEREPDRWRAEIRKVDGSKLATLLGEHHDSITTSADRLTAQVAIDEVKQTIDAGGLG
jgi:hypothetical protein